MTMRQALVFNTPDSIAYVRLASIKARINLESKGLRFSNGSTRVLVAAELGLRPRAPHAEFLAEIERRMEVLLEKRRKEVEAETLRALANAEPVGGVQ